MAKGPNVHQVKVHARTGGRYAVKKGEQLCFRAEGRWWDLFTPSGPEGYRFFLANVLDIDPVAPDQPFMRLMARLPGETTPTPVGSGTQVTIRQDGEVEFFANDAEGFYGNNWGAVEVYVSPCDCPPPREPPNRYQGIPGAWSLLRDLLERTQGVLFAGVLAIGVCLVLAFSQQGRDLVRAVGEQDFTADTRSQQISFALTLLFLAVQAWVWPRMIITSNYGHDRRNWRPRWLLTWLPRLLGGAPFVLVFWALKENPASNTGLIAWLVAIGLVFFVFLIVRQDLARRLPERLARHRQLLKVGRLWVIAGMVIAIGAMAWAILDPVGMGAWLGAPGVVLLGVGLIIPGLLIAIQTGAAMRIPALGILIAAAALFSLWMDNHPVGWRAPDTPAFALPQHRQTLAEAYRTWSDQAPAVGGVKPLVLVASEGGASRAGYWTAEVLAALHAQTHGDLPKSLFAISSVSGGSVGAVGYAASVQDNPSPDPEAFRGPLAAFAGRDFLSPTLTGMLFPDLLQRFLPVAILPDRAQALERGFERAWTDHCRAKDACRDPHLLEKPFLTLGPQAGLWRPIVIVNGASEETGRQVLTSQIAFTPDQIDADDFYKITRRDVAVSTAIHNGARFPWISPPGTLTRGSTANGHVVDGGYFEAGGVEVVRQLARAIQQVNAAPGGPHDTLRIIVVFIGYGGTQTLEMQPPASASTKAVLGQTAPPTATPAATNAAAADAPAAQGVTRRFLNEVTGPLVGLFGSRDAHASHLSRMLKLAASQNPADADPYSPTAPGSPMTYQPVLLCDQKIGKTINFEAPMDWALSDCAKAYMHEAAGAPRPTKLACKAVETRPISCRDFNASRIAAIAEEIRHPQAPPSAPTP